MAARQSTRVVPRCLTVGRPRIIRIGETTGSDTPEVGQSCLDLLVANLFRAGFALANPGHGGS